MHTSVDDTDSDDIPDLIDTNEDNNTKTMNSQKYWGFLSVPMGLAVSPARWSAQQNSNYNQDMGYSAVKLTEPSETDMDTDLLASTTKKADTNMNKTKINSPDIWIEDNVWGNTEVDKFIQTIIVLTKKDSPETRVKHWSQWF